MGLATVRMPLTRHHYLSFEVYLINQDVPFIFGLDLHYKHQCSSDELKRTFTHHPSRTTVPVAYKDGHLYVEWPTHEVMFSKKELLKLHERFSHPASEALVNLIRRADPQLLGSDTRKILDSIAKSCKACQVHASKPIRFKVSMPDNDIVFNHEIQVDLFWLDSKPAVHVIDRGTRYSIAKFIENHSAEHLWNIIVEHWVCLFSRFPDIIAHDQGSQFTSDFFTNMCAELAIETNPIPTESPNSLSICERYHPLIRRISRKIRVDFPTMELPLALSIACHAVTTTAGPDGLTPSLLIF